MNLEYEDVEQVYVKSHKLDMYLKNMRNISGVLSQMVSHYHIYRERVKNGILIKKE